MHGIRRITNLLLLATFVVVGSCTTERAPTAPSGPDALLGSTVETLLEPVGLLTCSPLPVTTASATIGFEGGALRVGPHVLRIPPAAVDHPTTITGQTAPGRVRAVAFEPHGLQFRRPVYLTMSYDGCNTLGLLLPKRIAYVDDVLTILEYLLSWDDLDAKKVTGKLDHFSQYAVAW